MHGVAHSVPLVPRQLVLPNQPKAYCQLRGRRETHAHTTLRCCQPPVLGRQPLCCPFATESGHAMHAVRWPRGRPCHPTAIWVVPEIEDQVRLQPGVCPKRSRPQFGRERERGEQVRRRRGVMATFGRILQRRLYVRKPVDGLDKTFGNL